MDSVRGTHSDIDALIDNAADNHLSADEMFDSGKWLHFLADAAALRDCGANAIAAVVARFQSDDPAQRTLCCDLLGRMPFEATIDFRARCLTELEGMLAAERAAADDPAVIASAASAFGHIQDPEALPAVLELMTHRSADVRFAVACAIPGVCNWEPRDDAIKALIDLSSDQNAGVRNWSCFGLGQLEADGDAAREALAARLDDDHEETRCEALVALAKTGDGRVYNVLLKRLQARNIWLLEIAAASELADVRLQPELQAVAEDWKNDDDLFRTALARCDPERHRSAARFERELVTVLQNRIPSAGWIARIEGQFPHTHIIVETDDGSERLNERVWRHVADPNDFNLVQERDSYLLTLGLPSASN
jgi:HEAT repeat protein